MEVHQSQLVLYIQMGDGGRDGGEPNKQKKKPQKTQPAVLQ